ncbi:MAG: Uma2 family endonuclease [Myxococcota bacterium]
MRAALRPRFTFAEYLELERMSRDIRHEYVGGEIYAMAGGSVEHSALAGAIVGLFFVHLRGGNCRAHGSDLRISIRAADVATYADAVVVCDPVERDPESPSHITNPRVVVEVLSPSTERYDREQKRLYYQHLDSLEEYVLIAQDRRRVDVWRREGEAWVHAVHGPGSTVELPSLDLSVDVDSLYREAGIE